MKAEYKDRSKEPFIVSLTVEEIITIGYYLAQGVDKEKSLLVTVKSLSKRDEKYVLFVKSQKRILQRIEKFTTQWDINTRNALNHHKPSQV